MRHSWLLLSLIAVVDIACSKKVDSPVQLDEVRVISATVNTAVVVNKILSNGGSAPTVVGTCWSNTNPLPTLENCSGFTTNHPGNDGQFTDSLKSLIYNTKYYLRAYGTNAAGIAYSLVDSFFTLQTPYPPGTVAMGGTVIWVDSTGMHGLIVASPQYVVALPWAKTYSLLGVTATTFGSGPANTQNLIAAGITDPQTAAGYCNNLVIDVYSDWFLPSFEELKYFRDNMSFSQWLSYEPDLYWTSSEATSREAFFVVLGGGADFNTYDKMIGKSVLPMRKF